MSYEVHNKSFQDEIGKIKEDSAQVKNSSHKAFIEKLKKQISSDIYSSSAKDTNSGDNNVCSEELAKALDAKFDKLFANLDDDN